jgi:hypothetical protein
LITDTPDSDNRVERCVVRSDAANRGKGRAVAFGLEWGNKELHEIVLILDADCRLNSTALRELDAAFANGSARIGGRTR